MKIGFLGLGNLGCPVAASIAYLGHDVLGYDIDPDKMVKKVRALKEAGPDGSGDFNDYFLDSPKLSFAKDIKEVVDFADIIFVCVATPHGKEYEGITLVPMTRSDFKYDYLIDVIEQLEEVITEDKIIAVISTVLPGTMKKCVKPRLNEHMKLVYTPATPAMGTSMRDFLNQEFMLIGVDDPTAADAMEEFYKTICSAPIRRMSVESAELTKVVYNTYITQKICYAQTVMEIAHKIPEVNVEDVLDTIQISNKRLMSPAYLNAGMHDSGGCHPRDLIALAWLAEELDLSYDWFGQMVECRERQMEFMAQIITDEYEELYPVDVEDELRVEDPPPMVICGYTFKKESNITTGSSALLVRHIIEDYWYLEGYKVHMYDPNFEHDFLPDYKTVYFIGMNHDCFKDLKFPKGSTVVDPFRMIPDQEGVKVIRLGE